MPKISIVLPTVNAECFDDCIEALFKHTPEQVELIVVADIPKPKKAAHLRKLKKCAKVIINDHRVGGSRAFNQGLREATGDLIVQLSDDVIVTEGWLEPLVTALEAHPEFGYVSPIVEREAQDRAHYFGALGEASLQTRETLEKIGLYDEGDAFQYQCADGDYFVRMRRAGYSPTGVIESRATHLVGQTIKNELDYMKMAVPMTILAERYGTEHLVDQHHLPAYSVARKALLKPLTSVYCTMDESGSSGSSVAGEEQKALKFISENILYLDRRTFGPLTASLPDSPFIHDYMAAQMAQQIPADMVHFFSGCWTAAAQAFRSRGALISYTVPAHDRRATIEEFARLGHNYPYAHIGNDSLWKVYKAGYLAADLIIVPSIKSGQFLVDEGYKGTLAVIPHGIDLSKWPQTPLQLPELFSAGYLGQIGPDKGVIYLLRAWKALGLSSGRELLKIAGPHPDRAMAMCGKLNVRGVQVLGWQQSVTEYLAGCSVYVQPSVTEGFGIEVVEAMACGRPVIVSDGAGAADVVTEGVNGFVVPARDFGALAERILWCRQNQDKLAAMGVKAWETTRKLDWSLLRGAYQDIWTKLSQTGRE